MSLRHDPFDGRPFRTHRGAATQLKWRTEAAMQALWQDVLWLLRNAEKSFSLRPTELHAVLADDFDLEREPVLRLLGGVGVTGSAVTGSYAGGVYEVGRGETQRVIGDLVVVQGEFLV